MNKTLSASVISLALLALPALSLAEETAPEVSTDGMQLVEKDRRGEIYADPGVDWSVYSKIVLDDATVAFRKNWQRDQNRNRAARVSTSDMEKMKSDLATLFDEVFVKELQDNGGFEIVDQAGEDVLRITPHIVDLDIYAPDTRSSMNSRSYTDSSGRMTLKLELRDSETGDLIAAASDRRESPYRGYAQWTTSVSNKADARRMLQKWAVGLRERLSEATGK
ncbi:MAG: DUF3313 family protein [Xanthomonadales bacterium]|jgi:hypothetical protein|nr:DUF3313 family protein [Xanthomonadales bacterium]